MNRACSCLLIVGCESVVGAFLVICPVQSFLPYDSYCVAEETTE